MQNLKNYMIDEKFVIVVRGDTFAEATTIIDACLASNMKIIEMTFTNPEATRVIEHYAAREDMIIGAGSILNVSRAEAAHQAGSKFIVGPNYDAGVQAYCEAHSLLYIPGCLTPTEIATAQNAGLSLVKIFPGNAMSQDYLKAIRGPMPDMQFMITGGVDVDNAQSWFAAGADCVGLGSNFTNDVSHIPTKAKIAYANC